MKKMLFGWMFLFVSGSVHAEVPPNQILVSLLQHVTAVSEFTSHGETKIQFLDGIVQMGHYHGDYILAIDGGVSNNLETSGHLAGTFGIHFHAISAVNEFFRINPALADTLKLLELNPRYSYDADVHHGVLGVTFGARIPF